MCTYAASCAHAFAGDCKLNFHIMAGKWVEEKLLAWVTDEADLGWKKWEGNFELKVTVGRFLKVLGWKWRNKTKQFKQIFVKKFRNFELKVTVGTFLKFLGQNWRIKAKKIMENLWNKFGRRNSDSKNLIWKWPLENWKVLNFRNLS